MDANRYLAIAEALLSQPTAPFHEDVVRDVIERRLERLPHVTLERDAVGNLIATFRRGAAVPTLAFVAHMDHPGFVGGEFCGGVPADYLAANPPVRSFGPFSMWDLPAFAVDDGLIHSRACDDLIGCAAIVDTLEMLEGRPATPPATPSSRGRRRSGWLALSRSRARDGCRAT